MKTLIIPDVHENLKKLARVRELREAADKVVFLGDFFDSFQKHDVRAVATAVKELLEDPKNEVLFGNHDCHYAFSHNWFMCSGYDGHKKQAINNILTEDYWRKFKVFTRVDGYLISHAGFHPATMHMATEECAAEALDRAFSHRFHDMFGAGYARGGMNPIGGPTYLDWTREFQPIDEKQIVGHSHDKFVRERDGSYCIDTGLNHVAWIEDGVARVELIDHD